jgi:hypothetical protein
LRQRRCYATTRARIIDSFFVNGAAMGSEIHIAKPTTSRSIRARVHGAAEIEELCIMRNGRTLKAFHPRRLDVELEFEDGEAMERGWYYLRARQTDGEMAWSSPVWVDLER